MAFPNNITAVQFSRFAIANDDSVEVSDLVSKTDWGYQFVGANKRIDMGNIRDMPSFGTPANIIKVPVYGRDQTLSVGAQPDAPDLEFTINYVGSEWDADGTAASINSIKADGITRPMMVSLLSSQADSSRIGQDGSGVAEVPNGVIFFGGRVESALFNPMRDDAATVTVALSVQTDFFGPFTYETATIAQNATTWYLGFATNTTPATPGDHNTAPQGGWVQSSTTATYKSFSSIWTDALPYLYEVTRGAGQSFNAPTLVGVR